MHLKDCLEEFIFDCECRHLSKGTLVNYRAQISFLIAYLADRGITDADDVKPQHIRSFLKTKQDQGCKPHYINDLLKAHKTMFNYLEREEYIVKNPASKVSNVRQPKVIIETFSEKEIKAMLNYHTDSDFRSVRNKTIIAMLFDTGVRCNELVMMEPEDVAADYIMVRFGKGNKERVVPKSAYLGKQLMRYLRVRQGYFSEKVLKHNNLFLSIRGKPLTGEVIARMLKDTAREVGVSQSIRVSPHTCRHTFAHMQLKNGLDVYSLSRLMGHVNISITQRYLQGIKDGDILRKSQHTSPLMNL